MYIKLSVQSREVYLGMPLQILVKYVGTNLTHLSLVPHVLGHHWFRQWLVAYSAPSHYLNQCWNTVNLTLRNKLQ